MRPCIVLTFVLLLTVFAFATQTATHAPNLVLEGRVADSSDAVIPTARVELLSTSGKIVAATESNAAGVFRLEGLRPGVYDLRVQYKGFASHTERVTIIEGRDLKAAVTMSTGSVTETVNVTAEAVFSESNAASATKMDLPLRDVPQSIAVVNSELMRSQAVTSMQEAVRNVPGVNVHLGEGRRDQILIRGFSALNDQFVDGFRDDSPYYRDLSNVDRIEVVKGPASVLYGRGSSGGIVNRITKSPVPEGVLAEISTMGGSYGSKRLATDFGMPFFREQLTFRITGAAEDSGTFRQDTGVSRYALAPSLLWQPSNRTQFVFQSDNLYDDRIPDRGIPSLNGSPAPVDKATYYGDPSSDYLRNKVYGQSLRFEHRTDRWNIRNNFRHTRYDNDFSNTQPNNVVVTDAGPMVSRQQYNVNSDQSNFFNQTEASTSAHLLVKHTILVGAEYGFQSRDSVRYTGTAASVSLVDPVLTPAVLGTTPTTNNVFDGITTALYVQDLLQFGQKWKAMLGGRFDYFKQTLWDRSPAQANLGRIDRQFSPRAGLVYQPHTYVSLYGNFSRSFQPSGEALSLAANAAELKPETTENYEIGGKFDLLGGRMDTTLSVFRLDRNNVKTTDPANPSKLLPIGVQRTDGVEISVSGRVINRLEVYGGYALLASTILKSNSVSSGVPLEGKRPAMVPRNSFNLWSTYTFENGFGFGGGIYYNDVRYAETNNLVMLPSYTRVDGTLFYRKRHYDIALNIRNLANADYYESAHANYQIMPGAPINGTITTRLRW